MPQLRNVEKRIAMVEGFEIAFMQNGADVRGDKKDIPAWPYQKQSKNGMTVNEWKRKFKEAYPGYDVEVYDGSDNSVTGQMLLGNLRDSYSGE
ncbi:MAG: hypothetical protein ACFNLM_03425 [Selenomonas noxia]